MKENKSSLWRILITNVEVMRKTGKAPLEQHRCNTAAGKTHGSKMSGQIWRTNRTQAQSRSVSTEACVPHKGNNSNFMMQKPGRDHLGQGMKTSITSHGWAGIMHPGHSSLRDHSLCGTLATTHSSSPIKRKRQTRAQWEAFYKINEQGVSKLSRSPKIRRDQGAVANYRSWKGQDSWM